MRKTASMGIGKAAIAAALCTCAAGAAPAAPGPVFADQGRAWTPAARADFYTRDQGSRIIPLAWLKALKTADGNAFLADGLARYGYLPNPNVRTGLPIGFMPAGAAGREYAAMNCSACHTREIAVGSARYRIDGGPAIADFQSFMSDLDAAVGRVLASDAAFAAFAAAVPNGGSGLKQDVSSWYERDHALVSGALPVNEPWGLGRLDAVSMIYNRLTGLDLGPQPSRLIPGNIRLANAPARYPFLWNAPKQDRTQWPGFSENGSELLALVRNLGQVYGVFGIYQPGRSSANRVDFLTGNSTNWDGLKRLEKLVKTIGPPKWPWRIDAPLAARGKAIFDRPNWQDGGCAGCHGVRSGPIRFPLSFTWATPLCDIGTDSRQYGILGRTADTGVLQGARRPGGQPLGSQAGALELLGISVIGSIFQNSFGFSLFGYDPGAASPPAPAQQQLLSAYAPPTTELCGDKAGPRKYESRVLQGIWAAAPYLHNGSVPTLADLLKKPADRPASFPLGRQYDTALIGLSPTQPGSDERRTTGCEDLDSGNSRCGHDFGTNLSPAEKLALLEYLKSI